MNFDVAKLDARAKYRLLTGGVTPRPVAWISTRSKSGVDNLAPYSFFTVASCDPPVLLYTQVNQRSGLDKDTLNNLNETGVCVVNIASADLLAQMNQTSAGIDSDQSEFDFAEVEHCSSNKVACLSVAQSPVRYECKLREKISLGDLPTGGTIILLDVIDIFVRDELLTETGVDQQLIDSVGKMGGDGFSLTRDYIELTRP